MLIIRRIDCINTASGIATLCKWLVSAQIKRGIHIIFFLELTFSKVQIGIHISEEPLATIIRICNNGSRFAVESMNSYREIMAVWF
jgi:hypothetical protein